MRIRSWAAGLVMAAGLLLGTAKPSEAWCYPRYGYYGNYAPVYHRPFYRPYYYRPYYSSFYYAPRPYFYRPYYYRPRLAVGFRFGW
jgi:hypothetical protein